MDDAPVKPFHTLIWLMPAAFAVHICEEWFGGFADWVSHVMGGAMGSHAFIENNTFFMAVLLALTLFASYTRTHWTAFVLVIWASANLFWDGLFHIAATAWFRTYSPGLISAVLLYLPVSYVVARAVLKDCVLSKTELSGAAGIGAVLMGFVIWAGLYHFAH